jgi:archaellum component FlaC
MSEERFDRIDARLGGLEGSVKELKTDVAVLKTDVAVLKTDVAGLKTDVVGLRTEMRTGFKHLGHQMRLLHEDLVDQFKALPDYSQFATKDHVAGGDADVLEKVGQRLDPLETAVRRISKATKR